MPGVDDHRKTPPDVEVRLLGSFELRVGGIRVDTARRQVRQLVAALAAAGGRPVSANVLLDELWSAGLPVHPRKALNVVVSRARSVLGDASDLLVSSNDTYRLVDVHVDTDHFVDLLDRSRDATGADAIAAIEEALSLWRGVPLAECTSDISEQRRTSLIEHHWFAITRLTELLVAAGDAERAAVFAAPFVEAEPFRERLVVAHATALALGGRRVEALRILATSAAQLRNVLGVDPSAALTEAEQRILVGAVDLQTAESTAPLPGRELFVGRKAEIVRMLAVPPGRGIVLVGEAGKGKTSLFREVAAGWTREGEHVIQVTVPRQPERPLDAVGKICTQLALTCPALVADFSTTLGRVCAELDVDDRDVSLTRDAMVANLAAFIRRAAADAVLIIDDAQWLDSGSIDVLRDIVAGHSTRIFIGMRPTDDSNLAFLNSDSGFDLLALSPLTVEDVSRLAEADRPGRVDQRAVHAIAERAGGNALFVRLLLDSWRDGRDANAELPTDILVAVKGRLDVLAERAAASLQMAAVAGYEFELHSLRQLVPYIDTDLETAANAGLVWIDSAADTGGFIHQLVADTCYELLAPGRRTLLHDEVGRLLQADDAPAVLYAPHFLASAELDPHRAVRALLSASAEFSGGFDWEHADELLTLAAGALHEFDVHSPAIDAELTVRRGIVGRARVSDRYMDDLITGAKMASELGDELLMAVAVTELCGHGRSTGAVSVDGQISELLNAALALELPDDHRAELCASASVLLSVTDESSRSRTLYREALDIARRLGDVEIEASVLEHCHLGLAHPDDFDLLCRSGVRLGEIAGTDPGMQWESAFIRFQTGAIRGDVAEVRTSIAVMRELTPGVQQRNRDFGMAFSESAHAQLRGDYDLAERHADRALEIGLQRYPDSWAMNIYSLLLFGIRRSQGRLGELDGVLDKEIEKAPDFLPYRICAAAIAHAAGDTRRAATEVEWVWERGLDSLRYDVLWGAMVVLLAAPTVAHGEPAHAARLEDALRSSAGRMSWNGASSCGPVDEALAEIAEARGEHGRAVELRDAARSLVDRLRRV